MAKINLNYARQLVMNYRDTKLGEPLKSDDTQAVWFSTEHLLAALNLPDNTDTGGVTGIRFYFGAYLEQANYPENAEDYNKLTLVMVPTGEDSMTIERGTVTEAAYLDMIVDEDPKVEPSYPQNEPEDGNSIFNDGQICPPPPSVAELGLYNW